jgi:hypothetical protein
MNAASRRARKSVGASTRIFRVSSSALSGSLSKISDAASNRSTAALPAWASRPPPAPRSRSNRLGRFLATGLTASPSYLGLAGPVHPPPGALAQPELSPTLLRGEIQSDRIASAAKSGCGLRTERMRCCVKTTAWFVRPLGRPPCAGRLPEILRAAGRTIYERFFVISVQKSSEAQGSLFVGARRHATLNAHSSHSAPVAYHISLRPRVPCSTSSEAVGRGWEDIQCGHTQVTESSEPAGRYRQTTFPRGRSVQPADSSAAADVLFIKRGREECRASAEGGTRQGRTRSWMVEAPTCSWGPA